MRCVFPATEWGGESKGDGPAPGAQRKACEGEYVFRPVLIQINDCHHEGTAKSPGCLQRRRREFPEPESRQWSGIHISG